MTNVPHHLETSKLICIANELTGFYMMGKLVLNGLMRRFLQYLKQETYYGPPWKQVAGLYSQFTCKKKNAKCHGLLYIAMDFDLPYSTNFSNSNQKQKNSKELTELETTIFW